MKTRLPVSLLLLAGLSGCVWYGRAGGPNGQPYSYGSGAMLPQNDTPPPGNGPQPYAGPGQ